METKSDTSDREIKLSRVLNAPVDLVWEVWTDPDHLKNWWGPDGFTNTISALEIRNGGNFNLIMHGPDGTDYRNESKFIEVIEHRKLVYQHDTGPKFIATINFEPQGEKTLLIWTMLFPTREILEQTVKTFNAKEGMKQNFEKLERYVEAQK